MKKKTLVSFGMAAVMGISVLAGCSQGNSDDIKNADELIEKMSEASADVKSMKMKGTEKLDGEISVLGQKLGIKVDMDLQAESIKENGENTAHYVLDGDMNLTGLSAMGAEDQNQKMTMEMYGTGKEDGDTYTTYIKQDGSDWTKQEQEIQTQQIFKLKYADEYKELLKNVCGEDVAFEKNGGQVNGRDTYKMDAKVSFDSIQELVNSYSTEKIDLSSWGLEGINMPLSIYVYKDDKLPAKLVMEGAGIGKEVFEKALGASMGLEGVELDMNIKEFNIEINMLDYNKVDKIEIPKEALEAK